MTVLDEVFAESKENTEWMVEKEVNISFNHMTSYRNEHCSSYNYFFLTINEYKAVIFFRLPTHESDQDY